MNDKDKHDPQAGIVWCWVIAIIVLTMTVWITSSWMDGGPSGRCRGELGYMGSVEYVECEE